MLIDLLRWRSFFGEDCDACSFASGVSEGFAAGAKPVRGLAAAAAGARADSAAVVDVGGSTGDHAWCQSDGGGAGTRLLQLEEASQSDWTSTAIKRPTVARSGVCRAIGADRAGQAVRLRIEPRGWGQPARVPDGL